MTEAYLNRISTAAPRQEVHGLFTAYAEGLLTDPRRRAVFRRMAERSQIERRWSCLNLAQLGSNRAMDAEGLFCPGAFPTTGERMQQYETSAPALAFQALEGLDLDRANGEITHLIVTSCTGFVAPGLDLQIVERLGLSPGVERTLIGFMGCYAAINALKLARHQVRSEPGSKVLVVSLELCTLHLQETDDLEQVLTFLVFGDGCAAALVSEEPEGLRLDSFHAEVAAEAADQITWKIRDRGFDMHLSGQVPAAIGRTLTAGRERILRETQPGDIDLWAVHPGGRTVLDAVESAFQLPASALDASRRVLREFGNMSSATVLFVLKGLMETPTAGRRGCAMAFGPGLTAETMLFSGAA